MSVSPPDLLSQSNDQILLSSGQLADDAFIHAIESHQLPPAAFDHQAHLRYAWLLTRQAPLLAAATRVSRGIQRFASYHGAAQKYHHSLTLACVALVAQRAATASFAQFLQHNPDLNTALTQVLAQYYHAQTLASDEARYSWRAPDLQALEGAELLAQVPHPLTISNQLKNEP